jgi:hypothetical protein
MSSAHYIKLILRCSEFFTTVFFIFDALDECLEAGSRKNLVTSITAIQNGGKNIKVLITSRPHLAWETSFSVAETLELRSHVDDRKLYIRSELEMYTHIPDMLKTEIEMALLSRPDDT